VLSCICAEQSPPKPVFGRHGKLYCCVHVGAAGMRCLKLFAACTSCEPYQHQGCYLLRGMAIIPICTPLCYLLVNQRMAPRYGAVLFLCLTDCETQQHLCVVSGQLSMVFCPHWCVVNSMCCAVGIHYVFAWNLPCDATSCVAMHTAKCSSFFGMYWTGCTDAGCLAMAPHRLARY
jgi:hypothetical protein